MNTRQEWLNTDNISSQFYSAEETISNVKENFDIRRNYSAEGASVIVDGIECRALVQYFSNPLNQAKYDKELHVPMEISINTGSLVEYEGFDWLITGNVDDLQAYKSAGMVKCNNTLKFYNQTHILHNIPCIIQNSNIKLDNDKFMFLPADEHILICSNNTDSSNIDLNTRFILNDNAYSIIGIDNISNQGLLNIRIKDDQINSDDNLDLSIANYYSHQIVREIYILNGTSASLLFNNATLQLNIQCKDNDVIVDNPIITYSSSNINIATVSSTGLITCKGTGDVIITAIYSGVSDTITIHGDISEVDDYNIVITPLDETLKISRSITLEAHAMKNGVEDLTREFIWEIRNLDGSSNLYASIFVDDANDRICVVTAGNIGNIANKYVVIKCSLTSDNSVYVEREIKLINLF